MERLPYDEYKKFVPATDKFTTTVNTDIHLPKSHYLHEKLYKEISKKITVCHATKFNVCNIRVDFEFWCVSRSVRKPRQLTNYVRFVIQLLHTINVPTKDLRLIIVDFNKPKIFDGRARTLSSYDINSGFTSYEPSDAFKTVMVYRREEMSKVILHELIHFFDIDRKTVDERIESKLNEYYGLVGRSITINECFTDSLACYLHVLIASACVSHNYAVYTVNVKRNLAKERSHVIDQGINMLKICGYEIINGSVVYKQKRKETTSIISYYVLKAVVYNNLDKFLAYLIDNQYKFGDIDDFLKLLKFNLIDNNKKIHPSLKMSCTKLKLADFLKNT